MADASVRRRGHGEDAIYFAADKNRYIGAVSLGFGPDGKRRRRKVSGSTKQEVRDKLKALHSDLNARRSTGSPNFPVSEKSSTRRSGSQRISSRPRP